ncbi:DNA gyrase inhibitor YacG [Limnohabitans planktonicus]|uniref:DNA gyrase inhibitor YacG n=1 Tax=Limnohabitans planktonicus II-D5 TaxID=1293045 RepID=A0A2T7UED1_9BURK|nr:DNA gyrase inhibitor YacG [Limnohabitans planktonicus]PVE43053.1 DNA gyrase inhibitor YacG [Limnohabitans planktonicus II-D5]
MSDSNPAAPIRPRQVRCPACGGNSLYSSANPYRPFCSARCKGVDLGAWASEEFKLPDDTPPDESFGDPRLQ